MVRKISDSGVPYHEPPYTPEEIDDMYRRMDNGPIAFTRPGPPPGPAWKPAEPAQPQEEQRPAAKPETCR
jgi:hypothetical protein